MKGQTAQTASKAKRRYRMGARAESVAATGERILDAAEELFREGPIEEATLGAIADRAGVTVQTILRRFGDRKGLLRATAGRFMARISRERGAARAGDVEGAVRILVEHYEEIGEQLLRLQAEGDRHPWLGIGPAMGRAYHREWCVGVFGAALEELEEVERKRRLSQLAAVTDVATWWALRRGSELSMVQTELAMRELAEALVAGPPSVSRSASTS